MIRNEFPYPIPCVHLVNQENPKICQIPMNNMLFNNKIINLNVLSANQYKTSRRKFTPEEDQLLKYLVQTYGSKKWDFIAKKIPGRTGRQCRDRYSNYLIPGFFNGQWTKEEDDLLKQKYNELGSQWSKMSKFFNHRNANALKNRWNYFLSKTAKQAKKDEKEKNEVEHTLTKNVENIIDFACSLELNDIISMKENETNGFNEDCFQIW